MASWPLKVIAWNANVGGGALGALWHELAGNRGLAAGPVALLLQEVHAADQEIPSNVPATASSAAWASRIAPPATRGPRTDVVSFARETGLSLCYVPSMRNGDPVADPPEDRGNAILANVPLWSPQAIELPFERQRRVAIAVDVAVGGKTIRLCSVHLENRAPWHKAWRTLGRGRRRQMAGLLEVLGSREEGDAEGGAEGGLHVLGGDFNTWVAGRRESSYRLARERFPLPEQPDPRPTHHLEIVGWPRLSDHLRFRLPPGWTGEYRRLDDTFGSDHYPLVGTVGPSA